MKTKVFIDGSEGTTGLRIHERFSKRDDIELLSSLRPNTWNHAIDFQQGADSILGPLPDF